MNLILNRAKMLTSTTGTGTVTLGAAAPPFQSFASAGAVNGFSYSYLIEDGLDWEIGDGVYTTAGTTFSRVLLASSTGSLLNLTGAATIALVAQAAHSMPSLPPVTILRRVAALSTGSGAVVAVPWDTVVKDPYGTWSAGAPTIVVPPVWATYCKVEVHGQYATALTANTTHYRLLNIGATGYADRGSAQDVTEKCTAYPLLPCTSLDNMIWHVYQVTGTRSWSGRISIEWFRD